jgi:hypothetical protein
MTENANHLRDRTVGAIEAVSEVIGLHKLSAYTDVQLLDTSSCQVDDH